MFADQAQHRGLEGLATLAVARPAAFARRQTDRAIGRKRPAETINLTPTQPHQRRSGINREPIIREISHHSQSGQFPIAHLDHPAIARHLERSDGTVPSAAFYPGLV
jgi:hypothetical protein